MDKIKNNISLEKQILELCQPNVWRWLIRIIFDWLLVFTVLYYAHYFNQIWSYALAILLIGPLQHAIGIMAHDGTHRRVHHNPKVNDFLTNLFGLAPLMTPMVNYGEFHLGHHNHTGTDKDGEIEFKKSMAPNWSLPITKHHLLITAIKDCLGLNFFTAMKLGGGLKEAAKSDLLPIVLFWSLAFSLIAYTQAWWLPMVWFAATMTSFWASFRLRLWAEHIGTTGTHRFEANWWQKLFFLHHNIDLHFEHHLYPAIPLWNLPIVRKLLNKEPIIPLSKLFESYELSTNSQTAFISAKGIESQNMA